MTKLHIKWLVLVMSLAIAGMIVYWWLSPAAVVPHSSSAPQNTQQELSVASSKLRISLPSGFYAEAISLVLETSGKQDVIRYTLDGSDPTKASPVYKESLSIKETTVLKAKAYSPDSSSSPLVTASYFIGQTHPLAVFSLSTNPDNLWSNEKGIYVKGPKASSKSPYEGANFWQDWKIPLHLEFFESGGSLKLESDLSAEIFGGNTRALPQKALALTTGKKDGQKLNAPLFPGQNILSPRSIVLRNSGQDFSQTHFRDGLVATLLKDTGLDVQAYRPVVVYLNAQYWGIHDLREKIDESFLASHHNVDEKDIDLLESDAIVKRGSNSTYLALINYIQTHDLRQTDAYNYVSSQLDVMNFMDYHIAETIIANVDWPDHNIRYWRTSEEGSKWKWIVYDSDQSFGDPATSSLHRILTTKKKSKEKDLLLSPAILQQLIKNDTFREQFLTRFAFHLQQTFQSDRVISVIDAIYNQMKPEMGRHLDKWGGSMAEWETNVDGLRKFAKERPSYMRKQLQDEFHLTEEQMLKYGLNQQD
ncbi:CotH kinase family protein [Paenibacillus sp. HWE-109]|uniref:CotH kinase family protein n=1 Tax=Paenibacillus sp. HWE-109 TaxID=1306526 RepID=UPI001EDE8284|nr:CotH kinase family protein [Paenibacillus sp. HWE-109]UKS25801.1 CotH kinase family protein [Paenibacillus sp. HWE-109]